LTPIRGVECGVLIREEKTMSDTAMTSNQALDKLNSGFTKLHEDTVALRRLFLKSRFDYLVGYCEEVTGKPYTPEDLTEVLKGRRYGINKPGTEHDPWRLFFSGRIGRLSEKDYLEVLYRSPGSHARPLDEFVREFNEYLVEKGVNVVLMTNGTQTFFMRG
jgi:hypothetical protein